MKTFQLVFFCFAISIISLAQPKAQSRNIFIITTDGFRWQEVFKGADSNILHNPNQVKDTALMCAQFW
ncbi:MAG: phosphoglyceromutase, partial [Bacteroidota bacterium]